MKVRPLPDSLVLKFGSAIVKEDWSCLKSGMSSTELVNTFENHTQLMVENIFPEKTITVTNFDKPYMTQELKKLRRQRQRIYRKEGKSCKYIEIRQKFDKKLKSEAEKYKQKVLEEVSEGKRSNAYAALRKLDMGGCSKKGVNFILPEYAENNLTPSQSAEKLADYFSFISQEFEPICLEKFPPRIKELLEAGKLDTRKPVLQEWQVYLKLKKAKKPNSLVPGDLPVKLVKEFVPELAAPITLIYNRITETAQYPHQWKTEYQLPIPKTNPPLSEDDVRNIASTTFFSKQYEAFISDWLFPFIDPFIDPGQCGGLKGSSITHYLVKLLHFTHSYLDLREPHAVLLALIDLEKAFNRVSHQLVIEDLAAMQVPGWLLLILVSYLTGRRMHMRYKGATSSRRLLPGSTPQGALLGILLFIIIFNGALLRPAIPRLHALHLKYVDDLSMLSAFNLKKWLIDGPVKRLNMNSNQLQMDLNNLHQYTSRKLMKRKEKKTQLMKFNFSKAHDFKPEFNIEGFKANIEVVQEAKILGIILTEDLKWEANTQYICSKAFKRMWILRRMKKLDVEPLILLDIYVKEIRSVLELAVPAWHCSLTKKQSADIERVQKVAISIILRGITEESQYSYDMALVILGLEPLYIRKDKLCMNFAKMSLKTRNSDMFNMNNNLHNTRHKSRF